MDDELVERLRGAAGRVLPGLAVRLAYLYGSRACGRPRGDSDVDVGVLCDRADEADETVCSRIADALASESGVGTIEVTLLDRAPIRFVGRVLRHRVVLYSSDEAGRVAFESRVGRMADDIELWAEPLDRELLAATAEGRR